MPIPSFTHPSKTLRSQPDEKQEKTKIPAESNASISSSGQQDLKIVDQDFAEFLPKRQSSKKSKEKYINLDVLNDYEAANLYKVMFQADDNDVKGIASKQPCIKKPDLLEDAVAQLSKTYLAEALLECNILVAIKHLLEPLPGRSLPSITLIIEMLKVIPKNHELVLLLESRKIVDQDFAEFLPKRQSSKKSKEKYINLDVLNDYEAANLYKVMFQADDNDVKGIASKQPCIKKPDLLEDAVAQLSKTYLAEALLECNILVAIKHLLEPLPETIRQLATQLVEKWSRSILGLSDDYREVAPTLSRKLAGSSNQDNFNLSRNISVRNKIPAIENLGVSKYYKKGLATTVNFNSNQTFSSDINSISSVQQQDDRENLQEIEDDADKLIDLADVVDNEVPNI
ncbi:1937_t:CDS:2 [Entrophospora sp. SA101]|nr:1937_t:CDS:2 [Entrophospora sp. SA101]